MNPRKTWKKRLFGVFTSVAMLIGQMAVMPLTAYGGEYRFGDIAENKGLDAHANVTIYTDSAYTQELQDKTIIYKDTQLFFKFEWGVDTYETSYPKGTVFEFPFYSENITFPEYSHSESDYDPGADGDPDISGERESKTSTFLYEMDGSSISVTIEKNAGKTLNYSGDWKMEAYFSADNGDVNKPGVYEIVCGNKTYTVYDGNNLPSLTVDKEAVGDIFYDASDDKFYQYYTVKVTADDKYDAEDVIVTDTPNIYSALGDVTVIDVDCNSSYTDNGDGTITIDWIDKGDTATITYKAEIKLDGMKGGNAESIYLDNTASASSKGMREIELPEVTDTDRTSYPLPEIKKSADVAKDNKTVTWTITITPNDFIKEYYDALGQKDKMYITVRDILDKNLHIDLEKQFGGKAVDNGDGTFDIPIDLFTYSAEDDTYTLTYTTEADASIQHRPSDQIVTNTVEVTFGPDDDITFTRSGEGTIGAEDYTYITKELVDVRGDTLVWKVKVDIPDTADPTNISIEDSTAPLVWGSDGTHEIVESSITVSVAGEDDTVYALADIAVGNPTWDGGYSFTLNEDFAKTVLGKTLIITYKSVFEDSPAKNHNNKATVKMTVDGENVEQDASDHYVLDLITTKSTTWASYSLYEGVEEYDESLHPLPWVINLTANDVSNFTVGQTITLKDTLPDNYKLLKGTLKAAYSEQYDYPSGVNFSGANNEIGGTVINAAEGKGTITFSFELTDDILKAFGEKKNLVIGYITQMTAEDALKFDLEGNTVNVTNTVDVYLDGDIVDYDIKATATVKPNNILSKVYSNGHKDGIYYYVDYELVINKDQITLADGNDYEAYDLLGTNLTLDETTLYINNKEAVKGTDYEYDDAGKKITFYLKDETAYTIEYTAIVNQVKAKLDDAAQEAMFGNTVMVEGQASYRNGKSIKLESSDYVNNASINNDTGDGKVLLRGTKTWNDNDNHEGLRPETIELIITKTNDRTGEQKDLTYTIDPKADGTDEFVVKPTISHSGIWMFEIMLISKEAGGDSYTYSIAEGPIGGYTAKLTGSTDDIANDQPASTKEFSFGITNTFDGLIEIGNVEVSKEWDDDVDSAIRPAKIIFELSNNETGEVIATRETTRTSTPKQVFTFEDLPIYTYEKASDGSVTKTPYVYKITEKVEDSDVDKLNKYDASFDGKVSTSKEFVFTLEEITNGKTKTISAVNKFMTGNLKITKSIDGLNVTDEEKAGALKFTVVNEDGKYLDDKGGLHDEEYEITLDKFKRQNDGTYVLEIKDVAVGKYTVTETNAEIDGYKFIEDKSTINETSKATEGASVDVTKGETTNVNIKDSYGDAGNLKITKSIDGLNVTDEEKAGALKFTVVNEDGKYLDDKGGLHDEEYEITLDKFKRQNDGTYVLEIKDVAVGKYTVTETNAEIDGYKFIEDKSTINETSKATEGASVDVTKGETTNVNIKDSYGDAGNLKITKTVDSTNITKEELEGALKFTVVNEDGKYLDDKGGLHDEEYEITLDKFKRQNDGTYVLEIKDVAVGKYTVTETNAEIDGYKFIEDKSTINETSKATEGASVDVTKGETTDVNIKDSYGDAGNLKITKTVDSTNITKEELEGALKFTVVNKDGKYLDDKGGLHDKKYEITLDKFKRQDDGSYVLEIKNVAVGKYTVTETNAEIDGYKFIEDKSTINETSKATEGASVDVTKGETTNVNIKDSYEEAGNLKITKTVDATNITKEELEGALKFTVVNKDGKYLDDKGGLHDTEHKITLDKFTRQDDGSYVLEIKNVVVGKYTVTETNAEIDGYKFINEKSTINETSKATEGGSVDVTKGETTNVNIKDVYEKLCNLIITKTVDAKNVTQEELDGALKFTVVNEAGKYLDDKGGLHDTEHKITLDKFTKQDDGTYVLKIENIEKGKYIITETNSEIEGYKLVSGKSSTKGGLTVTEGSTATIDLKDVYEEAGDLKITKTVDATNITKEELEGALKFTVVNKDGKYLDDKGGLHDTEHKITLDKFTRQDDGSYVLEIKNVAIGKYTVTETNAEIDGYKFIEDKSTINETSKATEGASVDVTKGETTNVSIKDVYEEDGSSDSGPDASKDSGNDSGTKGEGDSSKNPNMGDNSDPNMGTTPESSSGPDSNSGGSSTTVGDNSSNSDKDKTDSGNSENTNPDSSNNSGSGNSSGNSSDNGNSSGNSSDNGNSGGNSSDSGNSSGNSSDSGNSSGNSSNSSNSSSNSSNSGNSSSGRSDSSTGSNQNPNTGASTATNTCMFLFAIATTAAVIRTKKRDE